MPNQNKLTVREFQVLMALEEKPTGTYDDLAEKTGFAKSVVYNIIKNLENPEDRPKPYFSVVALPNLLNLGLEIVDVIVVANSEEQLLRIHKICEEHPYTSYHAEAYGRWNGILIQFRIPIGAKEYIFTLFQNLKQKDFIDDYFLYQFPSPQIYTKTDVHKWNPETLTWNFNWDQFFTSINNISNQDINNFKFPHKMEGTFQLPIKNWLKREDIAILEELFNNSRQRNIDMISELEILKGYAFSTQNFSRRIKRIKEECIDEYYLFIDPNATDILNSILILGEASERDLQKLHYMMHKHPIPFFSSFKTIDTQLFWYVHLPPTHISSLLSNLRKFLTRMEFFYIDHPNAKSYPIWSEAYNEDQQQWRVSESFMVSNILKEL